MYFLRSLSTHSNTRYNLPSLLSTSLSLKGRSGAGAARRTRPASPRALGILDDVDVIKLLEDRDLTKRRAGNALVLRFELDLLQRDKFTRDFVLGLVDKAIGALSDAAAAGIVDEEARERERRKVGQTVVCRTWQQGPPSSSRGGLLDLLVSREDRGDRAASQAGNGVGLGEPGHQARVGNVFAPRGASGASPRLTPKTAG